MTICDIALWTTDYEEQMANAHLIAAAPDLYEALKALTPPGDGQISDWWCPECQDLIDCATNTECCPHCGTYLTDCQPSYEWHQKARAALKRAEGKDHE